MTKAIKKLLVANRGEIACRIFRSASALGISTVAVYSKADRQSLHVQMADEALEIGAAEARDSYLNIDKLIAAAKHSKADAIHPGYGFLSENAAFAEACEKAGIIFVGPPAAAIKTMGSKSAAKALIDKAGVPVLPGYHGDDQSLSCFRERAQQCGYPVLLKAVAGGGGKGMRSVHDSSELEAAFGAAKREAAKSFGDDRLLFEKLLINPRHVEVQVFADQNGNFVYLSERDCSIQRRHQKIVEEAPAPGLKADLRRRLGEAAIKVTRAIDYVGAGTIEFLLADDGKFYFMEMNTRLQVEHPVTEMITGFDLVAWQLRIACGEDLPVTQNEVAINGHAIEVRICAEDPANDFLPATGRIEAFDIAQLNDKLRLDTGVRAGDEIGVYYDPLMAKLIAWGENRDQAQQRLSNALGECFIAGLRTNLDLLRQVVDHPAFINAALTTHFLQQHEISVLPSEADLRLALCAASLYLHQQLLAQKNSDAATSKDKNSPWWASDGWRLEGAAAPINFLLRHNEQAYRISLVALADQQFRIRIAEQDLELSASSPEGTLLIHHNSKNTRWKIAKVENAVWLQDGRFSYCINNETGQAAILEKGADNTEQNLFAPMTGTVVSISVKPGDSVKTGDVLMAVEAMKMEHTLRTKTDGKVADILCSVGQLVQGKQQLIRLESE